MNRRGRLWLLPVSVLVALVLGLLPLPAPVQGLRPYWLALVVAYWVIEEPERAGLGLAFVAGLLADLAFGALLGEQALAIGGLLLNDRVVAAALHLVLGLPQLPWIHWVAPLVGMVLWVPLFLGFDALRQVRRPR